MPHISRFLSRLMRNRLGGTLAEYCLVASLIAVAVAGVFSSIGGHPSRVFSIVSSYLK
ncbi:Flp family type IVb pilin [Pedomonas sp. V897]|uniref:Flp family type IVb pilin n=1 Tax=Pedomonas sp. V897 TaxID=3446482 RepID=UPI003EE05D97